MAHITADRVRDTSTTTGTGALTVSGTAPTAYRTFSAVCSTSDTFWYAVQHQSAAEWEVGLGTYSSADTVTRTTVLASSNSGSAVNFSAGTKDVFITLAATKTVQQDSGGAVVISANSSSDALRITQTGAGNALVVEDSANPDSTPFVVDAGGTVVVGHTTSLDSVYDVQSITGDGASYLTRRYNASSGGAFFRADKSRSASIGSNSIVLDGDTIGSLEFRGDDGANFIPVARIQAQVDGTPGTNDVPGRIVFLTTADGASSPTERMRIDSAGLVGIGTTAPGAKLNVVDNSSSDALRITQTGAGNAFVVEDSANPDSTPFVIDAAGSLVKGYTATINFPDIQGTQRLAGTQVLGNSFVASSFCAASFVNAVNSGASITLAQSRNTTVGSHTVVASGDTVGSLQFAGSDGTSFIRAASVSAAIDGTPGTNDMPGRIVFSTTADGASTPTERMRIDNAGNVGIGTSAAVNKLQIVGSFGRGAPVTKTGDFTLADNENWVICNKASSTTVTLPAASSWTGRELTIKTIQAQTVVSASSNVVPITDTAAGTAILPATDGAWATLVSDGTNWIIMAKG